MLALAVEESSKAEGDRGYDRCSIDCLNADNTDALSGLSKEKSPEVLVLFITQKCIKEKKK